MLILGFPALVLGIIVTTMTLFVWGMGIVGFVAPESKLGQRVQSTFDGFWQTLFSGAFTLALGCWVCYGAWTMFGVGEVFFPPTLTAEQQRIVSINRNSGIYHERSCRWYGCDNCYEVAVYKAQKYGRHCKVCRR